MPESNPPDWYPGAWTGQRRSYGVWMSDIEKLLLHTTESFDWPGYPTFAPTLTYHPWRHSWRQHMPIQGSASTLSNAGSFRTNRDNVVQIEIVGYADESMGARYDRFIGDIDQKAIDQLGAFLDWLDKHYGVRKESTVTWKAYNDGRRPSSYGYDNGVRLSVSGYDAYRGVLGHMHAPGNTHGDPGSLNVSAIIRAANNGSPPAPEPEPTPPPTEEDEMIERFVKHRQKDQQVTKKRTWQRLRVDNEGGQNVVSGPALVMDGLVHIVIDGLKTSDSLYIRPYVVDTDDQSSKTKRKTTGDIIKIDGPHHGWVRTSFPWNWNLGPPSDGWDGRRIRFEVSATTTDAVVKHVEITGNYVEK